MSSPLVFVRHAKSIPIAGSCAFCHARQFTPYLHGDTLSRPLEGFSRQIKSPVNGLRQAYATSARQKLDTPKLRAAVDERARLGFYAVNQKQGVLRVDQVKANSIAKEFLVNQKTMDPAKNIQRLTTKYNVSVEDIASLALVTYRTPDLSDPEKKAALPPSRNRPVAAAMLQGCALLEDPLALTHILTSVYLGRTSNETEVREFNAHLTQSMVAKYHEILQRLADKSSKIELGPEVLTLKGLFLEEDGNFDEAERAYTEAVQRCHFKFNPKSRHPMQRPIVTPWNALGSLLKTSQDPVKREQAKTYFQKGANEGDDPASCLELAAMEERGSLEWLRYISKAAASGHRDSMAALAEFYEEASSVNSPVLAQTAMRKALKWLLQWKSNGVSGLAREWERAAANMGHKPSLLKLADYHHSVGDSRGEKECLRALAESPSQPGQVEEWPQLAQLGRKRLAGIR